MRRLLARPPAKFAIGSMRSSARLDRVIRARRISAVAGALLVSLLLVGAAVGTLPPGGARWSAEPAPSRAISSGPLACLSRGTFLCLWIGQDTEGRFFGERWDGRRWALSRARTPATRGSVRGVSCVAPDNCFAVGATPFPGRGFIEHWDGRTWQFSQRVPYGSELRGVTCLSATFCMAAGTALGPFLTGSLIERWDGARWRRMKAPGMFASRPSRLYSLNGISCSSATNCVAVGSHFPGQLILHWNGGRWREERAPDPTSRYLIKNGYGIDVSGVSCVSRTLCMVVGEQIWVYRNTATLGAVALRWNGRRWLLAKAVRPVGSSFADISCTSTSSCVAVGATNKSPGCAEACPVQCIYCNAHALVERWNGARWRIEDAPAARGSYLEHVSCAAANRCVATGGTISSDTSNVDPLMLQLADRHSRSGG